MNKTIKIIELLNKIVKDEDVPKEIKYNGSQLKYLEEEKVYINKYEESLGEIWILDAILNDEVEIIEDEEEIDIQSIDIIRDYRTSEDDLYNDNFEDFRGTINELVKAVKQLDKKVNSIEQK